MSESPVSVQELIYSGMPPAVAARMVSQAEKVDEKLTMTGGDYKGTYTDGEEYKDGNLVKHDNALWVAFGVPPEAPVEPVEGTFVGAATRSTTSYSMGQGIAQAFTVSEACEVFRMQWQMGTSGVLEGLRAGICDDIHPLHYLGKGDPLPGMDGDLVTYDLDAVVSLEPGTTYYAVCQEPAVAMNNNMEQTLSGLVATVGAVTYGAGSLDYANGMGGLYRPGWKLVGPLSAYWKKIGDLAVPIGTRWFGAHVPNEEYPKGALVIGTDDFVHEAKYATDDLPGTTAWTQLWPVPAA